MQKFLKKALPIAAWLILWQVVALLIHNQILLAGPIETMRALIGLACTADFWLSIANSLVRIFFGLALGTSLGMVLGYMAGRWEWVKLFLGPILQVMRSVPVASFVILLLIWYGNRNISIIICMIVTLPIVYFGTLEGMEATDGKLLEMCRIYRVSATNRIRYIYLPQVYPFWLAALKLAVGMSFKSGVAAEVIGQPLHTMGNGLYLAKIYLETGELFAWTIVIVLLATACEKILLAILRQALPGDNAKQVPADDAQQALPERDAQQALPEKDAKQALPGNDPGKAGLLEIPEVKHD